MRQYYKAYYLKDLRQFSGWKAASAEGEAELAEDTICYLGDDFHVVQSPVQDKEPLFSTVTQEWQEFCHTTLKFEIPEDLRTIEAQSAGATSAAAV
ncbi:hypothetical protein [Tengunoibacter tsumagoiensis]|uniref:Uncharacterized protein n=1 Tax=Tengunoibacter tsumagoiensis TaxID=2014871 RepID=A0A402A702_9CHLR|nr:hypothetical protein [Tengunoibacter tsumagoiensis]GCE14869.1 hypothetical protein KTT_47280 [Tengunoibacter tsumagoiensis]